MPVTARSGNTARSSPKVSLRGLERPLQEIIGISRAIGSDPDLVQGGGGNTSVKSRDGRHMLVKATGTRLEDMDAYRGWAEIDVEAVRALLSDPGVVRLPGPRREAEVVRRLSDAVLRPNGVQPSVDASLHALLGRVVIHTHPVGLNALLCSRHARLDVLELLGFLRPPPLYVPYVDPGYTLALRVRDGVERYRRRHGALPRVVVLENHGLFVSQNEAKTCLELSRSVTDAGSRWLGRRRVHPQSFRPLAPAVAASAANEALLPALRGTLLRGGAPPSLVRQDPTPLAAELVRSREALSLAARGVLTPDQVLYCRSRPLVLKAEISERWERDVRAYHERWGADPRVVLVPKRGVFYAAKDLSLLKVLGEVYRSAMAAFLRTHGRGGPRLLSSRQAAFVESWQHEVFRGSTGGGTQPLAGRVAAVTGAGSGLGRNIAAGLIRAGATVFGLDVDAASLKEAACSEPWARLVGIPCDVTDEAAVASAFAAVERSAGGLDYLVNAAGIAPSFPLVDFPVAAWKKSLDINLTGYFLCAREAARSLLRQGAGGGIVNITSKSGLEASKANSAYNATKAGEIHLMRGWALELGRAGIRVNCVAPGNVFKGSRIWNEAYIRDRARQKGIRPEEVIPYYTSLSALGKEIEPEDIASAVVFLLSDASRNVTGQTLVVDGGQVMVR
jgi:NAD(P)-dependent dehydrogenase (short-subunit alcohol dehydrogenase family)/rhamnose utilization protein RhaD (predicted bifunctional aldolase and dehydrogenase)